MASELIAGLDIFKAMFDSAKGLKDVNDAAIRNAAVIELQEKILTAREQQAALLERIGELEEKVAGSEDWETEKQRYSLQAIAPRTFAYVLKRSKANGEPPHALCAHCYAGNIKSILQDNKNPIIQHHALECPSCKNIVKLQGYEPKELYVD